MNAYRRQSKFAGGEIQHLDDDDYGERRATETRRQKRAKEDSLDEPIVGREEFTPAPLTGKRFRWKRWSGRSCAGAASRGGGLPDIYRQIFRCGYRGAECSGPRRRSELTRTW